MAAILPRPQCVNKANHGVFDIRWGMENHDN